MTGIARPRIEPNTQPTSSSGGRQSQVPLANNSRLSQPSSSTHSTHHSLNAAASKRSLHLSLHPRALLNTGFLATTTTTTTVILKGTIPNYILMPILLYSLHLYQAHQIWGRGRNPLHLRESRPLFLPTRLNPAIEAHLLHRALDWDNHYRKQDIMASRDKPSEVYAISQILRSIGPITIST